MTGPDLTPTSYADWHSTPHDVRVPTDPTRPWLPPPRPLPPGGKTTRLLVEYDGTKFVGWAKQPGQRSVEAEFERVLTRILGECPKLIVGGRTDTGVHADGQVVSYDAEVLDSVSLNALLPPDVAVVESVPARPGFDPRNDAVSRSYRYRVLARRGRSAHRSGQALHVPRRLDLDALAGCADALRGKHDFTAFTPTETLHRWFSRTVSRASWVVSGDELHFDITADSFLRHMNRALVGTMLEVGAGKRTVAEFAELLAGMPRERAGYTAPPHGLRLTRIDYPE